MGRRRFQFESAAIVLDRQCQLLIIGMDGDDDGLRLPMPKGVVDRLLSDAEYGDFQFCGQGGMRS